SPLKVNGAVVGEVDRRKYEADYLKREQERERRDRRREGDATPTVATPADAAGNPDGLLKQTRQPGVISSSDFLRLQLDDGRYAVVGRARLEYRDVLRIAYYPTNLFAAARRRPQQDQQNPRNQDREKEAASQAQVMRLMNKKSKVTLWIEPTSHQILK